jgi:hypothetical protein
MIYPYLLIAVLLFFTMIFLSGLNPDSALTVSLQDHNEDEMVQLVSLYVLIALVWPLSLVVIALVWPLSLVVISLAVIGQWIFNAGQFVHRTVHRWRNNKKTTGNKTENLNIEHGDTQPKNPSSSSSPSSFPFWG